MSFEIVDYNNGYGERIGWTSGFDKNWKKKTMNVLGLNENELLFLKSKGHKVEYREVIDIDSCEYVIIDYFAY